MSQYKMVAFDMDGTLLNSQKLISDESAKAIARAIEAGKQVVLCTGRGIPELVEFFDQLPGLRYLVCVSGAIVYDIETESVLASCMLSEDLMKNLFAIADQEDCMRHLLGLSSEVDAKNINTERLIHYHMNQYYPLYLASANQHESLIQYYLDDPKPVAKFNLYHADPVSRQRTRDRIEEKGYAVDLFYCEETSLEITAQGANKGRGLTQLCNHLGIDLSEVIAVGDSDNDLEVLKIVGLPIAMGNANGNVKAVAKAVVADCDHDGCKEVVDKYLLAD